MVMSISIGSLIRYEGIDYHEDGEHAFGIVVDTHDHYNNTDSRDCVEVYWSDDDTTTREVVENILDCEDCSLELLSEGH